MRKQWIGACLLLLGALAGPTTNRVMAQWDVSGNPSINTPTPLGATRSDTGGIYFGGEFIFLHGDRALGSQVIATRGFRDTDGSLTGTPGQFVGSNVPALTTDQLGRTTWTPGFRATIGYKLEDGTSLYASYTHLAGVKYNASAGPVPEGFNPGVNLENSFLYSPVFNFSPQFSGPIDKVQGGTLTNVLNSFGQLQVGRINANGQLVTSAGSGSSPYGIWNGATTASELFAQHFDMYDVGARMPVFETEYSRSYALAGGRLAWIWEKYQWTSQSLDVNGNGGAEDRATYTNILSQRMYGPFIGVGNEVYLGNAFALSADITGAALFSLAKERAYYTLGDGNSEMKRSRTDYTIVPNVNAAINLWWYPIEGVQVKFGYDLYSFFNTIYQQQPVSFNAGAIDPSYKNTPVRIYQGFHFGVAYSF